MLRLGDGFEYLQRKAAQGHEPSINELAALVTPSSPFIWQAFTQLNKSREYGMNGAAAIKISEVSAYCEFNSIASPDQRRRILKCVQALDAVYLGWNKNGGT